MLRRSFTYYFTMAKKTKTFSHVGATDALERLGQRGSSAEEFVYELLRIFADWGDGQVRRTKEGAGNLAKDGRTILVKALSCVLAYRPIAGDADISAFYDEINAMREEPKIAKRLPRLFVVSDGVRVVAYDPKINDWYENSIDLLWKDFEFLTPLAGIEKIQFTEEAEADVKSAELMAKLFDDIRRYNNIRDPQTVHALNVFMSRLLFCFFAEDTGLFPGENLFTNTLKTHTKEDGSDLGEFIDRAFLAMSTKDAAVLNTLPDLYKVFPYVNGGLFKDRYPIPVLSRRARTLIINCGEYNWREINPDIFGSMIQAVVTPEQRAGLGMHYTSVPNIEKIIRPLFLDALEEEFETACAEAREKIAKKMNHNRATERLNALLARLSKIKFFDPACGSGNFLIISYKRLRDLEIRIWKALREIANIAILPFPNISLTQFYGIELDEYACDTATLSLWLAEHQMNVKFQEELYVLPETLPLKPSGHIVCGNACRLDWNTFCPHTLDDEVYIMGNPPYLGSSMQDEVQKEDKKIALGHFKSYKDLDYISIWFYKAAKYIKDSRSKAAFVSTNSICQGEQVSMLWSPIFAIGIEIGYAVTSFKWSNNAKHAAAVICVVVGLQAKSNSPKYIYRDSSKINVNAISCYLTPGTTEIIDKRSTRICDYVPRMITGNKLTDNGNFILNQEEKEVVISTYPELSSLIYRFMGSQELLQDIKRYCFYIKDSDIEFAYSNKILSKRLDNIKTFRENSTEKATRESAKTPHKYFFSSYAPTDAIIVPSVSSERRDYIPIGYVSKDVIVSNLANAIYDAEKWLFALLTSKMHNLWVRTVGGRLKTDYRYSATLCYNTFPFPKLTIAEKEELEQLAQNILDIREENFEMTLGEMYNPETMPDELREAHHQLDLAVEHIYRPEPFASDEERLEHLFKLYAKMTKK